MYYFKGGHQAMTDMKNVSFGSSHKGFEKYLEDLHLDIKAVKKAAENVDGIQKAVDIGWQGVARDIFLEDFGESIKNLVETVSNEYKDLKARLNELQFQIAMQDAQMYYTDKKRN